MDRQINESPLLHVRFEGRSFDIRFEDLDVGSISSDTDIKRALSEYLNVTEVKFRHYVVDRHATGNMTVRPEAVFG